LQSFEQAEPRLCVRPSRFAGGKDAVRARREIFGFLKAP
jgi:hypothetical protein